MKNCTFMIIEIFNKPCSKKTIWFKLNYFYSYLILIRKNPENEQKSEFNVVKSVELTVSPVSHYYDIINHNRRGQ